MEYILQRSDLTAVVKSCGAELVSFRDGSGTEYIWTGTAPHWSGQNPVLFPIVSRLKNGKTTIGGREYAMVQHGFARRSEFTVLSKTESSITLELRENEETLAEYPFPFALRITHSLVDGGFTTAFAIENTGDTPMPCFIGAHTGFNCPMNEGESFSDYELVFDKAETASLLMTTPDALISGTVREPCLDNCDRFPLNYDIFERIDTMIFEHLRSTGVALRHKDTGRGVHMAFEGFPMIGFWTQGAKRAPFLCIEPWHGCAAVDTEDGTFEGKRHCMTLAPNEVKELSYTVTTV